MGVVGAVAWSCASQAESVCSQKESGKAMPASHWEIPESDPTNVLGLGPDFIKIPLSSRGCRHVSSVRTFMIWDRGFGGAVKVQGAGVQRGDIWLGASVEACYPLSP